MSSTLLAAHGRKMLREVSEADQVSATALPGHQILTRRQRHDKKQAFSVLPLTSQSAISFDKQMPISKLLRFSCPAEVATYSLKFVNLTLVFPEERWGVVQEQI